MTSGSGSPVKTSGMGSLVDPESRPEPGRRPQTATRASPSSPRTRSVNAWSSLAEPIGSGCGSRTQCPRPALHRAGDRARPRPARSPREHAGSLNRPSPSLRSSTVGAASVGAGRLTDVGRRRRTLSRRRERVLDAEREGERIPGLRRSRRSMTTRCGSRSRPSRLPADEAMDRVPVLGSSARAGGAAVELVAPVLDAVRPRDQHLPPARGTPLSGPVSVQHSRSPTEYARSPPPTPTTPRAGRRPRGRFLRGTAPSA